MHNPTVVFVLLAIIVASVNAQCSCQSKPPVDVIYQGEACECERKYPVQLEVPKITEHRDAHYDYGFTIETPKQAPAEVKYSFDFHMEKPRPPPSASLATYAFEVEAPSQKQQESPKRYSFDYQVQTPVLKRDGASNLQRPLMTTVDRFVIVKPDCPEKTNYGCKCNSYKPTIDILQSCPKHGHLYQSGGILNPSNQQRYNQDPNLQQQIPDQVSTSADRLKRQVTNNFPKKIQDILPGLRSNNQISKVPTNEENSQNRNSEIMKMNFGVDPAEDIEELLRPKPLGFEQSVQSEPDQVKSTMPDFILKINPKLQEARSNIRSGISKIVNKARLDAIMRNHMIQKRSTEFDQSELSDVYFDDPYNFERSYETLSSAESDEKIEESDNHKPQFDSDPVNADEHDLDQSNSDRIRKHCDRCGELAQKFPCPSCGGMSLERSQPQYFEMRQGNLIPYIPGNVVQTLDHSFQPRYVFDRFGHRYLENNGKLKLVGPKQIDDDVTVGSYYKDPDVYSELKDILHRNSETIHSTNYKVGGDHLVQPMNLAHATDAIRFIQELTQKHNNQYNEDYYSNGESYEVGSSRNYPAKRSFKIIPLVEDEDDGSVLVKIAPTGGSQTKLKNEKLKSKDYSKLYGVDSVQSKPSFEKNVISGEKTKANFEKFVRDGKKYQILALSENGSVEGSVGSDEDLAILKYIYAVNRKEQSDENASTKISDENYSKNNDTQLKT